MKNSDQIQVVQIKKKAIFDPKGMHLSNNTAIIRDLIDMGKKVFHTLLLVAECYSSLSLVHKDFPIVHNLLEDFCIALYISLPHQIRSKVTVYAMLIAVKVSRGNEIALTLTNHVFL